MKYRSWIQAALLSIAMTGQGGYAAPFKWPISPLIAYPAEPGAVLLYDGAPPGTRAGTTSNETWTQAPTGREVRNVTAPMLLPVLPPASKVNGTAVIVAPGGGFRGLAIDNAGIEVARRLALEGISAFVLKYSVFPTPADPQQFAEEMNRTIAKGGPVPVNEASLEDGTRAVQLVRQRAASWGIRPDRIGAWQKAGAPVEFHLYGDGHHAFGMQKHGTTSDLWFEQFLAWMRMRGLLR